MSTWACRATVLHCSMPGVAGLRIKTLPASSVCVSNWCFSPNACK